jgi:thermostable 8-oxoguanine DNA glycosylase
MEPQKIKTLAHIETKELNIDKYKKLEYQEELTPKLDELSGDFDELTIAKIILWKVNRYAFIPKNVMDLLNEISKKDIEIDIALTKKLLLELLSIKGIRISMASTILRFKNPSIYQIIDQRVYRFICGEELEITNNIDEQAELYLRYLKKLREVCEANKIPFEIADRVLYNMDKEYNKKIPLKGYGKRA